MKPIKLSMAARSNPLRPAAQIPSLPPNPVPVVTRHSNIYIAIMAKNNPNYSAKSARQPSKLTIVLENHSKPNTFAPTASTPCSVGNSVFTSLSTNAATITVLIGSTHSTNSILRRDLYKKQNLLNSNSITFTANIYSRPMNLNTPRH